jgi:tRNA modification GTPase
LEEDLRLCGLHFRLVDTAGIRETEEVIEQEGIRRSKNAMKDADLILLLLDASRSLSQEDRDLLETVPQEKTVLVWNKIDQTMPLQKVEWPTKVFISAKERLGLEELRAAIEKIIWQKGPPSREEMTITTLRHKNALCYAAESIQAVIKGLQNRISAEFVASDIRHALNALGMIIGTNVTEDILTSIFSQFCLGK